MTISCRSPPAPATWNNALRPSCTSSIPPLIRAYSPTSACRLSQSRSWAPRRASPRRQRCARSNAPTLSFPTPPTAMAVCPCIATTSMGSLACPKRRSGSGAMASNYGRYWTTASWRNSTATPRDVRAKSRRCATASFSPPAWPPRRAPCSPCTPKRPWSAIVLRLCGGQHAYPHPCRKWCALSWYVRGKVGFTPHRWKGNHVEG